MENQHHYENQPEEGDPMDDALNMQPMSQNDIQDFLRKLQNDIEEGKNLLSQSVSSSVDFHNLR